MDSTSDSILAYKLTKNTVTLHNKVSNVCALIAGPIVSEVGVYFKACDCFRLHIWLISKCLHACLRACKIGLQWNINRRYNGLGDIMDIPLMLSFHMLFIPC